MKRLVANILVASALVLGAAVASANDAYTDPHVASEHSDGGTALSYSDYNASETRYADEYEYEDAFSNPLRLAYYVIYPVGFTVEWLVMRPFHYIISRPGLDRFFGYTPIGEEGTYDRMGERM